HNLLRSGFFLRHGQAPFQVSFYQNAWYKKSRAGQGHASAQNNLGVMYDRGQGVPQDDVQAHKWYNLASSRFPASEKERRDKAVKNRDIMAAKMTPAQIAEAQKLAREWKPKPEGK
ncbi:MAG: sel1 repeat family protein, partial [Alphaproteobacteria bacterium]|nr:sel1 repeat family protein [Alphaproteobacteria bacterium]